tara:strand:- start:203 stop:592 length:390 start_codon:yes stop_codon:yes gene_type:complete
MNFLEAVQKKVQSFTAIENDMSHTPSSKMIELSDEENYEINRNDSYILYSLDVIRDFWSNFIEESKDPIRPLLINHHTHKMDFMKKIMYYVETKLKVNITQIEMNEEEEDEIIEDMNELDEIYMSKKYY